MTAKLAQTPVERSLLVFNATLVARVHTYLSFSAFLTALFLGSLLHYKKIVKNGVAGYPQEWFPSVSATIGDWYPERNVFQIIIAITAGPRFALVFLQYFLTRSEPSILPLIVFVTGIIRTLSCGGWVYITSSDDHDAHDILMITYILCNVPWMFGGIACTPKVFSTSKRYRLTYATIFFIATVPMVYFFIQHKVNKIPGAYTYYAFFEWGLIFTDILYDSVNELDFAASGTQISIAFEGDRNASISLRHTQSSSASSVADSNTDAKSVASTRETIPKSDCYLEQRHSASTTPPVSEAAIGGLAGPLAHFLADVYLAYVFWSIFTSLVPTLFYFSIWELGIAGGELALLSILSPIFLGLPCLKNAISSRTGRVVVHALSLGGLAAYRLKKPLHRLFLVAFANVFLCMGTAVDWAGLNGVSVSYQGILLGLGLILSSISKQANYSNNPVWPLVDERSGNNKIGITLAALALADFVSRRSQEHSQPKTPDSQPSPVASLVPSISPFIRAMPLGSLLYGLHCFLSDASTLIAWTWTGYPIKGPVPHLHGYLTILAQSLGLLLALLSTSGKVQVLVQHPVWLMFGALSSWVLYAFDDWIGYIGGLGLAVFLMSIIPRVFVLASRGRGTARTYFYAFLVFILLLLANVWTVAYAFVPGGEYLRERSDLVLFAQITLLAPAFIRRNIDKEVSGLKLWPSKGIASYIKSLLWSLCITSALVTFYHTPLKAPQPYKAGPRIVRAGIWTVHFGLDNTGRDSQRGMKQLIDDMQLDIVGLLETDLHRIVYGNRDLTRVLTEESGYYVDLGPGPDKHTWGAVLLSKFPILSSTHHLLPSPHGELAPAISAVLDVWGTNVTVIVAHNGQEEDPLDRELQSTELARIMTSTYPQPLIFLGYVVTKPHAPRPAPYDIMVKDGRVHDIDAEDLDRWCEYIFYRGLYRTSYLRMSRGSITDTEMQVGQFVVPRYGYGVVDSEEARYLRRNKEKLPVEHWFPMEYYGNRHKRGKNGHYYHVFGTPLYYAIPEGAIL